MTQENLLIPHFEVALNKQVEKKNTIDMNQNHNIRFTQSQC